MQAALPQLAKTQVLRARVGIHRALDQTDPSNNAEENRDNDNDTNQTNKSGNDCRVFKKVQKSQHIVFKTRG